MSEREDELDARLERALEALPEERPAAEFERDLRARFVGADSAADASPEPPRRTAGVRRMPWVPLAVAAGLVLALGLAWRFSRRAPEPWRVIAIECTATLDGHPLSAQRLASGGRLRTGPGGGLQLMLGRHLALSVGADSELVLPAVGALEGPQDWLIEAAAGHLALATGPAFPGSRLAVRAPDVEVEVVGTRFAVDVYEEGTCVCCNEGRVRVTSRHETPREDGAQRGVAEAGQLAFGHAAGGITSGAIMPDHLAPLRALEGVFE